MGFIYQIWHMRAEKNSNSLFVRESDLYIKLQLKVAV